jgi:hypothetical protein
MRLTRLTFVPLFDKYERDVFGRCNNTGHGGCWINNTACDAPDCIMAMRGIRTEVERRETRLWIDDGLPGNR